MTEEPGVRPGSENRCCQIVRRGRRLGSRRDGQTLRLARTDLPAEPSRDPRPGTLRVLIRRRRHAKVARSDEDQPMTSDVEGAGQGAQPGSEPRPAERHGASGGGSGSGTAQRRHSGTRHQRRADHRDGARDTPATGAEAIRAAERHAGTARWWRWGPYLAERQWGTVREDYSADGDAWDYLPARPCPLARLPLGRGRPARHLRRPRPAVLRAGAVERGRPDPQGAPVRLSRPEGNHGEDVKEYYFYLDATPTALLHARAVQVSAARLPLRRAAWPRTPARPRPARVRAGRHRHLRRGPLLRRRGRIRQGRARRHPVIRI